MQTATATTTTTATTATTAVIAATAATANVTVDVELEPASVDRYV
jgi:hypothetical protein